MKANARQPMSYGCKKKIVAMWRCLFLYQISSCDASSDFDARIGSVPMQSQHFHRRFSAERTVTIIEDLIDFWRPRRDEDENESSNFFPQNEEQTREVVGATEFVGVPLALSPPLYISPFNSKKSDDGLTLPLRSTGTTIAGLVLEESGIVLLGADTRATDDTIVADKSCSKIHMLSKDIYACGAGTSGDLEATARQVQYSMKLDELKQSTIGNYHGELALNDITIHRVIKLLKDTLYDKRGKLGVNLILGGQGLLVALHPHGSIEIVPYAALGSGGLAAMAVLESKYHSKMSLDEAKLLISQAIKAGIDNDLGSGSQVDLCILYRAGKVEYIRAAIPETQVPTERTEITREDDSAGVNGFGNVIYKEQSRQKIMKRSTPNPMNEEDEWNSLCGL